MTKETQQRSVLVVDDSAFMRKLICEMIEPLSAFRVAGTARDGLDAIVQVERLNPDIITLDLEMPGLDGLEVLRRIMSVAPRPVIVLSAGGIQYGDATLRALELGAIDFVRKPSGPVSLDLPVIRDRLVAALRAAASATITLPPAVLEMPGSGTVVQAAARASARRVVVIAASTGGPRALAEIIPQLPQSLCAAVVIAQHLPREFTAAFVERLRRSSTISVREAVEGDALHEGTVYVARGGCNTLVGGVRGRAQLLVQQVGSRAAASPNADILFASASEVFEHACTGVVLTGMGRDGARGLAGIRQRGGGSLVQDQATSAIYGMPRAALAEAGADAVVALDAMAHAITHTVSAERLECQTA
ncbi:MAG: chemotaxis-specific protein-glutamate methyltransferase CheB [Gemmatimonadota bacterium]|nr:chemotaxis-specific protein-glutamate methyltransferase CheB [Gemmatimonadota bacterium]